jgi:hypothetical protein
MISEIFTFCKGTPIKRINRMDRNSKSSIRKSIISNAHNKQEISQNNLATGFIL